MIPKYQLTSLPPELARSLREQLGLSGSPRVASQEAAADFLRARQLATLWGGTELPSLQEAVSGEAAPRMALLSSPVIGKVWVWAKGLAASGEFVVVKLFRLRATFVARPLWPALAQLTPLDPEASWKAGELSTAARQIADFIRAHGPRNTLELRQALPRRFPILPQSVKKGLGELEEKLIIFPKVLAEHQGGKDVNTWELLRRGLAEDGKRAGRSRQGSLAALARLLEATVGAAGVVDTRESSRWFPPWKAQCRDALAALVKGGKLRVVSEEHPSILTWSGG